MLTVRTSSSQLYGARCVKGLMLFIVNDSRRKYSEGLWFEYQLGPEFFFCRFISHSLSKIVVSGSMNSSCIAFSDWLPMAIQVRKWGLSVHLLKHSFQTYKSRVTSMLTPTIMALFIHTTSKYGYKSAIVLDRSCLECLKKPVRTIIPLQIYNLLP